MPRPVFDPMLMAAFSKEKLEDGRARLVRYGHLPERQVMTGMSSAGESSARVKSIEELLQWLHLKGLSAKTFRVAFVAVLSKCRDLQ